MVNSGQKKVIRATSFAKKSIVKSFNFEELAQNKRKKRFPEASKVVNTRILETVLFWKKKHLSGILSMSLKSV